MKVYELIQQLSKFNADTEVEFHVKAKFDADVEAEFDRDDEDDTQEVTVTVEFNDDDCVRNPIIPKILQKLKEVIL